MSARIRIGTCSWTDPTLIRAGTFYPESARTAEERLAYYASQFDIVEVDSSYYAMPSRRNATLWTERTPDDFVFNIKAFRILTHHPTPPQSLPADIRGALPASLTGKQRLYYRDLPDELRRHLWARFEDALLPLDSAGKLGLVLFQFPPWFNPGVPQLDHILTCKKQLSSFSLAVEFRNNRWLSERQKDNTIAFLKQHGLSFVCVDEPQGFTSSVPPVVVLTADTGIVRFHGRKSETWQNKSATPTERFDYYYDKAELAPWATSIREHLSDASEIHVLFNTNNGDQGVVNAKLMARLLQ